MNRTLSFEFPELLLDVATDVARRRHTTLRNRTLKILRDSIKREVLTCGFASDRCSSCSGLAVPVAFFGTTGSTTWICLECVTTWTNPHIYETRETRQSLAPRHVLVEQVWKAMKALYGNEVEEDATSAFTRFIEEETVAE